MRITHALTVLHDHWFDTWNRVDTHARWDGTPYAYEPTGVRELRGLFKGMPADAFTGGFVDYGCGKGRALLVASEFAFDAVEGVEYDPGLATVAKNNTVRMGIPRIRVSTCDAREHRPSGVSMMFFYDPFPADTMDEVLSVAFGTNNSEALYLVFHNESTRDVMERFADHVDVMPEISAGKTTFSVYRRTRVGALTRF